jgi:hypothetical protein
VRIGGAKRAVATVTLVVIALVVGVLGITGPSHAEIGAFRIVIGGALAAPSGTSADTQVTLRLGVGLPVFEVLPGGAVGGGSIATATFARWTDTVATPGFLPERTLMVFRLSGGLMVIAAGVSTPNGLATSFSAAAPYQNLTGNWDIATGPTPADALVTFTYDTNPHIKNAELFRMVAGSALSSLATKSIPLVASVDALRNVSTFEVTNNAKGAPIGALAGHSAYNIVGHASEFVELRAVHLPVANLFLLYGCAAPVPGSAVACLVGGTGFVTHVSGHVNEVAGALRKDAIAGVVDADLVLEMTLETP